MSWPNAIKAALVALLALGVTIAAAVGFVLIPRYQVQKLQQLTVVEQVPQLTAVERFNAENDARRTLAEIVGGLGLLLGLYLVARRIAATEFSAAAALKSVETTQKTLEVSRTGAQETLRISREGQITERFSQAIQHLADERLEVRLGGIYALERIARDSQRDHWIVFEVLTAFVREKAHFDADAAYETKDIEGEPIAVRKRVTPDVQAVLTVMGRRNLAFESQLHEEGKGPILDLRSTNLYGADLQEGNFSRVRFESAHLEHSTLHRAIIEYADFTKAHLQNVHAWYVQGGGATFYRAGLFEADFAGATFTEATFEQADIRRAWLVGACLNEAELRKADLRDAHLSGASLRGALLAEARVKGADFAGAHLEGANLGSVRDEERREQELERGLPYRELAAIGLTKEQIDSAVIDKSTILPEDHLETESSNGP